MYLTYLEYGARGGTLDDTAFARYEKRASKNIDAETHGRVSRMSEVPESVKDCVFELVEYNRKFDITAQAVTSRSQSAGNVSESESYATRSTEEVAADITEIIWTYLSTEKDDSGVPLLYRGWTP